MKRFLAAVAVLAPIALAPLAPACSSSTAPEQGDNGDAGPDQQGPTIGDFGDAAYVAPEAGLGTGFPEAGTIGPLTCKSNGECLVAGQVCGFRANAGCNATGGCMLSDPPIDLEGVIETACGCDGGVVLYVATGETAAPVASSLACGFDASTNAPDANDGSTNDGATNDAAPDATSADGGDAESD